MARSPVRGATKFRRLLRRAPDAIRGEILVELNVTGRQINNAVLAKAPRKSGALHAGLSYRVLPLSMRLQVGLLGSRQARSRLFYGRIQDLGRLAQIVTVRRRGIAKPYKMRVRAMAPKRFVTGRYPELRSSLQQNLRGILSRGLRSISEGGE